MSRLLVLLLLAVCPALAAAQAQPGAVRYELSFPTLVHHEAEISVTFTQVPPGALQVRMSRSSPGRYALHEFAKNVYSVRALDGQGRLLPISRPDPHQWDVEGHDGTVVFRYTLFGDRADGTYTALDNTHAHLNMPATFAWARGLEERPVEIRFSRPREGWRIATQLVPTRDPERFTAPDLQYFMDSPTEISDFDLRTWEIEHEGRRQTIRLAVHHVEDAGEVDAYEAMARRVVHEQLAVYGEPPAFDHGTYTFIACYTPWVAGDGMEHRNSTILTSTRPLSTGAVQNLSTLAHEFFHAWSVERLRPASLEPFDFEEANMSGELWFAEGFTSYYTPLTLRRTGALDDSGYALSLSGTLQAVINGPGRRYFSPVEMSLQAPFVDAAASIDPQNRANTFISYYTWGSAIGLGLDLTLRARFDLTLDGYMRLLWDRFGRVERPYTIPDLRRTLADFTGDPAFAEDFFARYIEGREVVDYAALLARAGYLLRPVAPTSAWIGSSALSFKGGSAQVTGPTLVGMPLYAAGAETGDVLLTLAGRELASEEALQQILESHRVGDRVELTYQQRGERRTVEIELIADPRLEVVPFEAARRPLTPEIERFRATWLDGRTER